MKLKILIATGAMILITGTLYAQSEVYQWHESLPAPTTITGKIVIDQAAYDARQVSISDVQEFHWHHGWWGTPYFKWLTQFDATISEDGSVFVAGNSLHFAPQTSQPDFRFEFIFFAEGDEWSTNYYYPPWNAGTGSWRRVEPSNETPAGESVLVLPPPVDEYGDPIEDAPGISFTFEDVETGGDTTVVVTEPGEGTTSAPSGFRITGLTGGPVLFDINTTATLAEGSTFEVCFDYSGMDVAGSGANLTLAHEVEGEWFDITTSNDTTNMVICGVADSFSYFAILESLEVFGPTVPIAVDTVATLGIDVGDPTLTDILRWEWGDGSSTDVPAVTDEILTEHTYTEAGVYTVTARLLVGDSEAGSADFQYVVVYDPSAGFVTGGGWFNSPAGAYMADLNLIGKANFGFVSKYKKGAMIPSGNTEFQFKAGDLSFRSTEYEWLVIAGARAQFKGNGTIHGLGNYGFMLKVVDEALTPSTDTDLFRIKIWDKDNGDAVVYDNGLGADDDSDPPTMILGGSIVVHKAKTK